jgi:hypothetical protein
MLVVRASRLAAPAQVIQIWAKPLSPSQTTLAPLYLRLDAHHLAHV